MWATLHEVSYLQGWKGKHINGGLWEAAWQRWSFFFWLLEFICGGKAEAYKSKGTPKAILCRTFLLVMLSIRVPSPSSSNSDDGSPSRTPLPDSTRRTTHTGKQSGFCGLGYGVRVAYHHLRPFIPFILISILVMSLIYLLQAIIYGGPFKDPLFFVKFYERWPRPSPVQPSPTDIFSPVPSSSLEHDLSGLHRDNETAWAVWWQNGCPLCLRLFLFHVDLRDGGYTKS